MVQHRGMTILCAHDGHVSGIRSSINWHGCARGILFRVVQRRCDQHQEKSSPNLIQYWFSTVERREPHPGFATLRFALSFTPDYRRSILILNRTYSHRNRTMASRKPSDLSAGDVARTS
jgi:hypothetical protein